MTYLIVGIDGRTLVPWHRNVLAPDASTARQIGRSRAANEGVVLVVAAVIGAGRGGRPHPADPGVRYGALPVSLAAGPRDDHREAIAPRVWR